MTAFGGKERLAEMYEIETMMVTPEKQGRGYATALMRMVLEQVRQSKWVPLQRGGPTVLLQTDSEGRDVFLVTGRSHGFYETLGFSIAARGFFGKNNPKWKEDPVPCYVVSLSARPFILRENEADCKYG